MKYTLLDLTQQILASMDSDEVNSINDTTESASVVKIIKQTYFDIAAQVNLPRQSSLFQLTASGDPTKPVTMSVPDNISRVDWIRYNVATTDNPESTFRDIHPLPLVSFLDIVLALNTNDDNVISYTQAIEGQTFTLLATDNRRPTYYTTIDDDIVLFDSYDSDVDTTLQSSKTMGHGEYQFPWTETDSFVCPFDDKQFQILLNEAKSLAFAELKQSIHQKAEKTARQLWINSQTSKTKAPLITAQKRGPNYGRC